MKIYEIQDKKLYLDLLLLADEQESMINKYLNDSLMYVIDDNGIKGEIIVKEISNEILEIKNLAIYPKYQNKGYGKKLIEFICNKYKTKYSIIQVGTGDSPLTIPFYEKCGFIKSHIIKDFFTDNYDHPIFENGIQLVDMIYLQKSLN